MTEDEWCHSEKRPAFLVLSFLGVLGFIPHPDCKLEEGEAKGRSVPISHRRMGQTGGTSFRTR